MTPAEARLDGPLRALVWLRTLRLDKVEGRAKPSDQKLLLLMLAARASQDGEEVTASVATIAADCQMSERWVGEALLDLKAQGFIVFLHESKGGSTHRIGIKWDEIRARSLPNDSEHGSESDGRDGRTTPNSVRGIEHVATPHAVQATPHAATRNPERGASNPARGAGNPAQRAEDYIRTRRENQKKNYNVVVDGEVDDSAKEQNPDHEESLKLLRGERIRESKAKALAARFSPLEVREAIRLAELDQPSSDKRPGFIVFALEDGSASEQARRRTARDRERANPCPQVPAPPVEIATPEQRAAIREQFKRKSA